MSKILKATSLFLFLFLISGFVFSSPQKTQAACTAKPGVAVVGYQGGVRSVTYTVRITNNCGGSRNFRLLVSQLPTSPQKLVADWVIPANGNNWNQAFFTSNPIRSGGSRDFTVKVRRNIDVFHPNGTYYSVVFKANVREGGSVIGTNNTRATHYVVQNRPDFKFRAFSFPGGLTCRNTKPTVIIRNIGWVGTDKNIVVQVKNRAGGQTINHTVTQFISKREIIDLTNKFGGMNRPAPGTYDAIAVVDLNNNVVEEDEGNNKATSRYTTSPCSPRGAHDSSSCEVSTGWACDPDNFDRALTIHFYEGSTYLGATTANKSRPDVKNAGKCGSNANVGFTWATPANLKDGATHTIKAFALNVGPTGGNVELPSNRSFTCPVQTEYHAECNANQQCVQVPGAGANTCSTNADCVTPTFHSICQNQACVQVAGPGTSTCSTNADCQDPNTGPHSITGGLFEDLDGDGELDAGVDLFKAGKFGIVNESGSITRSVTTLDGDKFNFNNLPAGKYFVTYNKKVGDTMTVPGSALGDPVIGNITIGTGDCIDGTYFDCDSNGNAINVLFGVQSSIIPIIPKTWLQGNGGDMRIDEKDWENDMPSGSYFSDDDPIQKHGIVFGNSLNLGLGIPNLNDWYIEKELFSFPVIKTKFSETRKQLSVKGAFDGTVNSDITPVVCTSFPCSLNTNPNIQVYTYGDLALGDSTIASGKKHIFLIDGDLTIEGDITVEVGAFAMFVVSGDIIVKSGAEQIDGIYSADKNFTIEYGPTPITINGSVIVNAEKKDNTFLNEREGGDEDNPSAKIIYRPDFVLNASKLIMTSSYSISEVAPGNQIKP